MLRGTGTCALEELGVKMLKYLKDVLNTQTEMSFIGKKKKACIDAQKSFTSFHSRAVKPCGPVCNNSWDGKCEE